MDKETNLELAKLRLEVALLKEENEKLATLVNELCEKLRYFTRCLDSCKNRN